MALRPTTELEDPLLSADWSVYTATRLQQASVQTATADSYRDITQKKLNISVMSVRYE